MRRHPARRLDRAPARHGVRENDDRGRDADRPSEIPPLGWKDIGWRLWEEFNKDRILLIAAGASFYLLLALFPALAAFVSLYGFVADPVTVADHVAYLGGLLPPGGLEIIRQQLLALARQDHSALGVGFFVGLAIALWSANSGIKALFDAMNIAYEETEKRSFLKLNLLSITFTIGAILIGIGLLLAVGVVPAVLAYLYLDTWTEMAGRRGALAGPDAWRPWRASRFSTASGRAANMRNGAG